MNCQSTTAKGFPCQAIVLSNSRYCFSHSPEASQERRAAQSRGGRGGRGRHATPSALPACEFDFSAPEKMSAPLAVVANMLLQGMLDAKTGHAVCHAADTALRAYSLSALKTQMDRVERLLASKGTRPVDPAEIKELIRFEKSEEAETIEQLERTLDDPERRLDDDD
jgi:hypothetical protein